MLAVQHPPQPPISGHDDPEALYKASGVLLFTTLGGETHVLLFKERRNEGTFWIDIGGKREKIDRSSWDTALREFDEEIPNLSSIHPNDVLRSIWIPHMKYMLYCVYKKDSEVFLNTQVRWFPLRRLLKNPRRLGRINVHKRLEHAIEALC